MIRLSASRPRPRTGTRSRDESPRGSVRLLFPLVIITTLLAVWVLWRYGLADETISRLPGWFVDFLGLSTGAALLTLAVLWLILYWQWRAAAGSRQAAMTLAELTALSPRDFEHYVADLFETRGYAVTVRGRSGDLGVDLEVVQPDGRRAIVQCKRYRHPIGPDIVRELFGTMVHEMVHHGFLVTTAEITTAAREWAKGKPITLIDGPALVNLVTTRKND